MSCMQKWTTYYDVQQCSKKMSILVYILVQIRCFFLYHLKAKNNVYNSYEYHEDN